MALDKRPTFADPFRPNGYAWWYIDAESDDGTKALSAIAFVGSVFSPTYAKARRSGATLPQRHIAVNLALYGSRRAWVFVEGDKQGIQSGGLKVGGTTWRHTDDGFEIHVDETTVPWRRPIRGVIRLKGLWTKPSAKQQLDSFGRHFWWPAQVSTRIEVSFSAPKVCWEGSAYHDINWGDEPLASGFSRWDWLRQINATSTQVFFRLEETRQKGARLLNVQIDGDGRLTHVPCPEPQTMGKSRWGLVRWILPGMRETARVEDTPFYSRSRFVSLQGRPVMHETLDLRRWSQRWVQFLLSFRLRRQL